MSQYSLGKNDTFLSLWEMQPVKTLPFPFYTILITHKMKIISEKAGK
jgi:hypothetical protein